MTFNKKLEKRLVMQNLLKLCHLRLFGVLSCKTALHKQIFKNFICLIMMHHKQAVIFCASILCLFSPYKLHVCVLNDILMTVNKTKPFREDLMCTLNHEWIPCIFKYEWGLNGCLRQQLGVEKWMERILFVSVYVCACVLSVQMVCIH